MSLTIKKKKIVVNEINKIANNAVSVVIADSNRINANKMNDLRKSCRNMNVYIKVVRNTLLNLAFKDTSFECLKNEFIGPTIIAYSLEEPGTAARLFKEFAESNSEFKIKAAAFNGKLISADKINLLADIPTLKEAIIHLIITMKEASILKLLRIMIIILNLKKSA